MKRLLLATLFTALGTAQTTVLEKEAFLSKAKVVSRKDVNKGVTGTARVTLSDGVITHDASFQTIESFQQIFQPAGGKAELNFKDDYKFNIAAWELAQLIGLEHMVPPSVERTIAAKGALTWWIDDVQMEEGERLKQKINAPDAVAWQQQVALQRMFDQLIHNNDRNVGNLVIDKGWHLWMIDHTRAFRTNKALPKPANLTMIDRGVLEKMKALNEATLKTAVGNYLSKSEMQAVLARRDAIVKIFQDKGPGVLFDLSAPK